MSSLRLGFVAGIVLLSSTAAVSAHADVVTGKIVGPDGNPVSGARVFVNAFFSGAKPASGPLISDTGGAFSLDIPPIPDTKEKNPKVALVVVAAPGFGLAQTFLTLQPGDSNTVHLEKSATLQGKVVDTAGKPVAGAQIRLRSLYMGGSRGEGASYLWIADELSKLPGFTATTDANGGWTLEGLPAKAVHASVALVDTKYVQIASDIPLGGGADKSIVARLGAVLIGKVVGADGKPRGKVTVSARQENYGAGMANAITGADGSYRLSGLPTGSVAVWVYQSPVQGRAPAKLPAEVAAPLRQVVTTEGKETTAPNMVLTQGGVVEGTVTDAVDGTPVPNVQVMVPDSIGVFSTATNGISDAGGKFALRLPPGTYRLSIPWEPEGHLRTTETGAENLAEVKITDGATVPVSFRLARALTISGIAQDTDGKPAPGVKITVVEQGNPAKTTTDSEGKWTLKGVKPGNLRLVAANDYEVVSGNEVTLSAKEAAPPVRLTVKPFHPAPLSGRVVTTAGNPVAGLRIQANTKMLMGGGGYWFNSEESRTDDQGRFTLPPVRPENPEMALTFNKPGYKLTSGGTLKRQGEQFVIIDAVMQTLDRGRTLTGRVIDAAGKPVIDAMVAVPDAETGPGEVRTDASGGFILPGVPEESQLLAAKGNLFGAFSVTRKTDTVVVHLAPVKMDASTAAEDRARAAAILWGIKKRSGAAQRQSARGDYFTGNNPPYVIAPLNFSLALALAKPEGTNPVDDQVLAQMIRKTAKHSPERINDWAIPALEGIGVTAVRASAFYEIVLDTPAGPVKQARAKQVYQQMQGLTLTGSEHWVVRRITQMAVLAQMLGLPDESKALLSKAITQSKEDKDKQYIGVVAYESVFGGLPMVRDVLAKASPAERVSLYWQVIPRLARINARAARTLLGEMEADTTLPVSETKNGQALLEIVRALAPQNPEAALQIAETMGDDNYQSAALALTARSKPDGEKAALLYQRAASLRDASYSPEVMAKIAALAWQKDPALGKKFFSRAKQMIREQDSGTNIYGYYSRVKLATEYYEAAPGESRLMLAIAASHLLSADGLKQDDYGTYRQALALAWMPFNVDRALAVAEMLPEKQEKGSTEIRNETLTKIAVWLLTEPSKRSKLLMSDYDQYGFDPRDY